MATGHIWLLAIYGYLGVKGLRFLCAFPLACDSCFAFASFLPLNLPKIRQKIKITLYHLYDLFLGYTMYVRLIFEPTQRKNSVHPDLKSQLQGPVEDENVYVKSVFLYCS